MGLSGAVALLLLVVISTASLDPTAGQTAATASEPSTTIAAQTPDIKFVELTGEITVNEGEQVALRCVVSEPVEWCEWLWRPLADADADPIVVKRFPPALDRGRDCSVRFPLTPKEHEGLWSCAVLAAASGDMVEAPATSLQLLPPVNLRFLEFPVNQTVALGHSTILPCVATSSVKDCLWTWHPLNDTQGAGIKVKQFAAFGNNSRDCSINFKSVQKEQDGFWRCSISNGSPENPLQAESPLARLTTFVSEPIAFTKLSHDVYIPNGSYLFLQCVASSAMEECQWSHAALNHSYNSGEKILRFPPQGNSSDDCSLHINATGEDDEGFWTCGARRRGESFMTTASPVKVTLQKQESVLVNLWATPGEKITLACQLRSKQPMANCTWQHLPKVVVSERNHTARHIVKKNSSTGLCTIMMDPKPDDLGEWKCVFTMSTRHGEWEIAAASLTLLISDPVTDQTMNCIIGVLSGLVLLLIVLVVTILVCKRTTSKSAKSSLGNPAICTKIEEEKSSRYTGHPTKKINFQFGEDPLTPSCSSNQPSCQQTNHIYEPVDRYLSPGASKSIYENVN